MKEKKKDELTMEGKTGASKMTKLKNINKNKKTNNNRKTEKGSE